MSAIAPSSAPIPTAPGLPSEDRTLQVDWPQNMRLGESDVVSLKLVPAEMGYLLVSEFPDHQEITRTVTVTPYHGYELFSSARLDGVNFHLSPQGEQVQYLPGGTPVEWRWSVSPQQPGNQRLSLTLKLRWVPLAQPLPAREVTLYSAGLDVRVASLLGLTHAQALLGGLVGLLFGGTLCLSALVRLNGQDPGRNALRRQSPNSSLRIDLPAGLQLGGQEKALLMSLFQRYARLVIRQEFKSGYSGARTFLALPIRQDGRSDAFTIAKLGERASIQREFRNFEAYVKDRLPPITARIQHNPVELPTRVQRRFAGDHLQLAALQYTFIGEPGESPLSLHDDLSTHGDADVLYRLFETFGPGWWLQRQPYTFRWEVEYDRVLPAHFVMEPAAGKGPPLLADGDNSRAGLQIGELASLQDFKVVELRHDRQSLSLQGNLGPGRPAVRVRWMSASAPGGLNGRIVATRRSLLEGYTSGCDLLGLPDPLPRLPQLLDQAVSGSQSVIHGDLNLENVLVGPGHMLWLIDFAQTREGHTLFDFAHLQAEIIAHHVARRIRSAGQYLDFLHDPAGWPDRELAGLTLAIHNIAGRCLFNPAHPAEFRLALALTCLGALKFATIDQHARHLLFLTAAFHLQ